MLSVSGTYKKRSSSVSAWQTINIVRVRTRTRKFLSLDKISRIKFKKRMRKERYMRKNLRKECIRQAGNLRKECVWQCLVGEIWSVCSITVSEVLAYTHGFLCAFLHTKKGRKNGFLLKVWKLFFTQRKVSIRTGTQKFLSLQ